MRICSCLTRERAFTIRRVALALWLAVSLAGEEPALEISYGGDGPLPSGLAAMWWQESVAEAAVWLGRASGQTLQASDAACAGLHLAATSEARADGRRRLLVSGAWQGATPGLVRAWTAMAPRWHGPVLSADGTTLHVRSERLPLIDRPLSPGWRVALSGSSFLDEARAFLGEISLSPERVRLLQSLRVTATCEAAGVCKVLLESPHLPAVPLSVPDPEIAGRISQDAALSVVTAGEGSVIRQWELPWEDLAEALKGDPDTLAAAVTGTWALEVEDAKRVLLVVPSSPISLGRTAKLKRKWTVMPWKSWLLVTNDPGMATAWIARPPRAPGESFLAQAVCDPARLLRFAIAIHETSFLDPGILGHWPLPASLLGQSLSWRAEQLVRDLNVAGFSRAASAEAMADALAPAGRQSLTIVQEGTERVRLTLQGSLLGWAVPGLAIRWFTDYGLALEGERELRTTIEQFRKDGRGALPADMLQGVPEIPPAEVDASMAVLRSMVALGDGDRMKNPPISVLAESGLPPVENAGTALAQEVLALAERLPKHPAADRNLRWAEQEKALNAALKTPAHDGLRVWARAGAYLAWQGDPAGLDACTQALRQTERPESLLSGLNRISLMSMRDDAHLACLLRGKLDEQRLAAWLGERCESSLASAWHGERLLGAGWMAEHWLGLPSAVPPRADQDLLRLCKGTGVWMPRATRAWTAGDLAAQIRYLSGYEDRTDPQWPEAGFHSDLIVATMPALTMITAAERFSGARHRLMRLAARLYAAPSLPVDEMSAAAVLQEPLAVPYGPVSLALQYERRGQRGFRLAIDVRGDPPPGMSLWAWSRWKRPMPKEEEIQIRLPGSSRPEVILHLQDRAAEDKDGRPDAAGF